MTRFPKPPGPVAAAAMLLYAYGGLMLLCAVCSGLTMAVDDPDFGGMDAGILKEVPSYKVVEIGALVLNLLTAAAMIVIASGLLRLMPGARIAAYVVTTFEILQSFLHSAYTAILVIPAQERIFAQEEQNLPPMPMNFGNFMNATMWGAVMFTIGFTLAFCVPVIFLLSTSTARAAFASEYFDPPPDARRPRRYYDDDEDDGYGPPPNTGFTDRR